MPKEHFNLNSITSINGLKTSANIHVIGVSGVAMAQMAVALSEIGFSVSGSDKEFYEPMGSYLRNSSVKLCNGYSEKNINKNIDLVIIGNAVSYNNVEVIEAEKLNLPYSLFTKVIQEIMILGKKSIVITGTHGKSTTTSFTAGILKILNLDPSYFIGGISKDLPKSLSITNSEYSVIEGDEYDSAFFAKVPKFSFYLPDIIIINAIEYDHADIYENVDKITNEFNSLIEKHPKAEIIFCIDFKIVKDLFLKWKEARNCISFGFDKDSDYQITDLRTTRLQQEFNFDFNNLHKSVKINLPGAFNARNALAAILACQKAGINIDQAIEAIGKLNGVKRRQEIRFENENLIVIEDFAHHPTAVSEAILAIKSGFPEYKLTAVFEPRSNTSRKKVFQNDYIQAFKNADKVLISKVEKKEIDTDLIDVRELVEQINKNNIDAEIGESIEDIIKKLSGLTGKNIILIMSNGSFGGLISELVIKLKN